MAFRGNELHIEAQGGKLQGVVIICLVEASIVAAGPLAITYLPSLKGTKSMPLPPSS